METNDGLGSQFLKDSTALFKGLRFLFNCLITAYSSPDLLCFCQTPFDDGEVWAVVPSSCLLRLTSPPPPSDYSRFSSLVFGMQSERDKTEGRKSKNSWVQFEFSFNTFLSSISIPFWVQFQYLFEFNFNTFLSSISIPFWVQFQYLFEFNFNTFLSSISIPFWVQFQYLFEFNFNTFLSSISIPFWVQFQYLAGNAHERRSNVKHRRESLRVRDGKEVKDWERKILAMGSNSGGMCNYVFFF